jgi:hypothetical protein
MPVAAQIEPGNPPRLWWILSGTTPAGSKRVFQLFKRPVVLRPAIEVTKDDSILQIRQGDTKIMQYNHAPVPPPEGKNPLYTRSGFIHPLWSPTGDVLTEIHPADHIHHVGIWMPWTKTKFEGKEVDFWNLAKGDGTVRFVKFLSTKGCAQGRMGCSGIQHHRRAEERVLALGLRIEAAMCCGQSALPGEISLWWIWI